MSALPPEDTRAMRAAGSTERRRLGDRAKRWEQLQRQAQSLAKLAGLAPESDQVSAAEFSKLLDDTGRWQSDLAREAIEDMDAMVRPGIAALKTLCDRGQDTTAPALALWREYYVARGRVLELLAPQGRMDERHVS